MKGKILWIGPSFLLVVALALSACATPPTTTPPTTTPPTTTPPTTTPPTTTPPTGEPQYGGTVTFMTRRVGQNPSSWDQADGMWGLSTYIAPYMETLLTGDVLKYGPRGTNEFAFELTEYVPEQFLRGQLAESWELTTNPLGVKFRIRRGCMYYANPKIGFTPREVTAYDAAFSLNRYRASSVCNAFIVTYIPENGFEALDKYTLQVRFNEYNAEWPLTFAYGYFSGIYPPEVVKAGAADAQNHVGSGPFILTDFVRDSSVTYKRNPDWWDKEKIINGKKYNTPFIEYLRFPIIIDTSTRIAALRTGKIDMAHDISLIYEDSLKSTSPDLILKRYASGNQQCVRWQCASGLFADKNLRRAMSIGTDRNAVVKASLIAGEVHSLPFNAAMPTAIHTPIKDLPLSAKELFTYDPQKAKQMIIDAGYPNGLKIDLEYSTATPGAETVTSLLVDMWAKIGVQVTLKPYPSAVHTARQVAGDYQHAIFVTYGTAGTVSKLDNLRARTFYPFYKDKWFNEQMDLAMSEYDEVKRNKMLKELGIYVVDTVESTCLGMPYNLACWWPWVKNYYGETEGGYTNYSAMVSTLWIDRDLKRKMGH